MNTYYVTNCIRVTAAIVCGTTLVIHGYLWVGLAVAAFGFGMAPGSGTKEEE